VLTEEVEVTRPDVRLVRDRRHLVGVDQARPEVVESILAGEVVEQRPERVVGRFETGQQRGQLFLLGGGHRGQRIERRQDQALFVLGQLDVGHRHGWLLPCKGELDAQVTVDDVASGPVDEDLCHPANLCQRSGQGPLLLRRMRPPVPRVWNQVSRWHVGVADDAIAPRRGSSGGGLLGGLGRHAVCSAASRGGVWLIRRNRTDC
jgi:hypothetical protein